MMESDLTEYLRSDIEKLGYTTYAEVKSLKRSNRCDMYAKCEDINNKELFGRTIAFEAKLSFNLKVIQQAYFWKINNLANEVYIVVPYSYKDMSTRKFAREICKSFGIGVIEVNMKNNTYNVTVKSTFNKNVKEPKLYAEQKDIIASNSDNKYITPFKMTVKRIDEYMKDKNSEILLTVIKSIDHHYKSDISACRAIKTMIERNVITNYNICKVKNKILIHKHGF